MLLGLGLQPIFDPQQLLMMKGRGKLLSHEGSLVNPEHGGGRRHCLPELCKGRDLLLPQSLSTITQMNGVWCGHQGCSQVSHFSSFWAVTGICFPSLELGRSLLEQRATCFFPPCQWWWKHASGLEVITGGTLGSHKEHWSPADRRWTCIMNKEIHLRCLIHGDFASEAQHNPKEMGIPSVVF